MKKTVWFLSVVLIIGLIVGNLPAIAATTNTVVAVDNVTVQAGTTVDVPITISGNKGICGATFSIRYDNRLTLTGVKNAEALSSLSFTKPGNLSANPVNLVWYGLENDTSNGTMAVLTFSVPDIAGKYDIFVSYIDGDVVDGDLMPVNVSTVSGGITISETSQDEPTVMVESVSASGGATVEVPVKISGNTGICGATFIIRYDNSLTLTGVKNAEALSSLSFTKPGNLSANPVNLVWYGLENDTSNGTIAVLTFSVPDKEGIYDIEISYIDGDVVDGNLMPIDLKTVNGKIEVKSFLKTITVNIGNKSVQLIGGADATGTIFVAFYDENGLISVKEHSSEESTINESAPTLATYAKAMWWKDNITLVPVCKAEKLELK